MRSLRLLALVALIVALSPTYSADAAIVAAAYDVGEEPYGIAVDPTDGRLYVANSKFVAGPGSVSVIDPVSGKVGAIATSAPSGLVAVDAVNRRLYSSNADRTVQVFDLATSALEASLPVGGLGIVVDAATRRVYVAGSSYLAVIDGATNTVVLTRTALPGELWFGLAHDPALHQLYVSNVDETAPSLVVLDDRDLSLVHEIALTVLPRFAIAVDSSQHRVYVAGADKNYNGWPGSILYAIDGGTFAVVGSAAVPGYPAGIALDPAAHRIYVTKWCASCSSGYREIDDRTFEVVKLVTTPWTLALPALHPDGRLYVGAWTWGGPDYVVAIDPKNHAPAITSLSVAPSAPLTNSTLQVTATATDPDLPSEPPATLVITYQWLRNGAVIAGAIGTTLDLSAPGAGDRGDTITVRVTAGDGDLSVTAETSVVVGNTAPTVSVSLSDPTPKTNAMLVATATGQDADSDALTYTYTWSVNGVARRTATTASTTDSFDLGPKGNGDKGDIVSVSVVADDGSAFSPPASASATVSPGGR